MIPRDVSPGAWRALLSDLACASNAGFAAADASALRLDASGRLSLAYDGMYWRLSDGEVSHSWGRRPHGSFVPTGDLAEEAAAILAHLRGEDRP